MIELRADPMYIALAAEYESAEDVVEAAKALRAEGYTRIDAYTPYRIEELTDVLDLGRTRIPLIGFIAGVVGCAFGFIVQTFANTWDFPINVGGRPLFSVPAFIPISYESTILFAGCAIFFAMFFFSRLPEPWNPLQEVEGFERATVDRFWIGIDGRDPHYDAVRSPLDLGATGALRVVRPPRLREVGA